MIKRYLPTHVIDLFIMFLQYKFPHVTAVKAKQVKISLPHIKDEKPGDARESANKVDASYPGSALHMDGEIFPITHPQITFK